MTTFDAFFADLLSRERCSEADYDRATDLLASGAKSEADLIAEWTPLALEIGTEVTFKDLKGRADLNGLSGTVVSFVRATGRFGVKLATGGETVAVQRANLEETECGESPACVLAGKIGDDVAGLVGSFLTCTRCRQPCAPGSKCRVPHPMHLRQELGMMSGQEGMRASYGCKACGERYDIVTPWTHGPDGPVTGEPKYEGPEWCYAGLHSSTELPPSDLRRVHPATVSLSAGPNLQAEIDALPADVRVLTITAGSGFYDEDLVATLERHMPDLEELQLVDVAFERIVLTEELTPALKSLRMQNVPNDCDLRLELPALRQVSIHFLGDCDETINEMLARATVLP